MFEIYIQKKFLNVTYSLSNEDLPSTEQIPAPLENVDGILLNLQKVHRAI